jgi:hypothetical protein
MKMVVIGLCNPSGTMRPVKLAVLMEEYPVKDFKLTQTAPECFVSFELRQ